MRAHCFVPHFATASVTFLSSCFAGDKLLCNVLHRRGGVWDASHLLRGRKFISYLYTTSQSPAHIQMDLGARVMEVESTW